MACEKWIARHITESAQDIMCQIPIRAGDRGLDVVDSSSIVALALWSLLLWERKVGRVALERLGVDPFDLARCIDRLLEAKAYEHPVVYDVARQELLLAKSEQPYQGWDFDETLAPLLQQAEHEALELSHNYVGTEHLLLAIVRLAPPYLSEVLRQFSVDHTRVRDSILTVLHP